MGRGGSPAVESVWEWNGVGLQIRSALRDVRPSLSFGAGQDGSGTIIQSSAGLYSLVFGG